MRKLFLFVLLLVGCTSLPAGEYYLVPAENITPDYTYCEGEQCWKVQLVTEVPQITDVPFNTPTPEPPIPTVEPRGCLVINENSFGVRVRAVPNGTQLGVIEPDQMIAALAQWQGENYLWYKLWWDETRYAWTAADFYTVIEPDSKPCQSLPTESPF